MKATKKLIAEWKKVYKTLVAEGKNDYEENDCAYWVNEESHFESVCVGWCMGRGMGLADALDFYREMIPLKLF